MLPLPYIFCQNFEKIYYKIAKKLSQKNFEFWLNIDNDGNDFLNVRMGTIGKQTKTIGKIKEQ